MQRRQFLQAVPATLGGASLTLSPTAFPFVQTPSRTGPICLREFEGHMAPIKGMLALEGRRLLSWAADGDLRLWNGISGEAGPRLQSHVRGVEGVCLPARGRAVSRDSLEGTLRVWNLTRGYLELRIDTGLWNLKGIQDLGGGWVLGWGGRWALPGS